MQTLSKLFGMTLGSHHKIASGPRRIDILYDAEQEMYVVKRFDLDGEYVNTYSNQPPLHAICIELFHPTWYTTCAVPNGHARFVKERVSEWVLMMREGIDIIRDLSAVICNAYHLITLHGQSSGRLMAINHKIAIESVIICCAVLLDTAEKRLTECLVSK